MRSNCDAAEIVTIDWRHKSYRGVGEGHQEGVRRGERKEGGDEESQGGGDQFNSPEKWSKCPGKNARDVCVLHFVALAHHWMQVCKTILCSAVGLTYGSTDLLLFMRFTFFLLQSFKESHSLLGFSRSISCFFGYLFACLCVQSALRNCLVVG